MHLIIRAAWLFIPFLLLFSTVTVATGLECTADSWSFSECDVVEGASLRVSISQEDSKTDPVEGPEVEIYPWTEFNGVIGPRAAFSAKCGDNHENLCAYIINNGYYWKYDYGSSRWVESGHVSNDYSFWRNFPDQDDGTKLWDDGGPEAAFNSAYGGEDAAIIINKGYYWKFDYENRKFSANGKLKDDGLWRNFTAQDGIYPWTEGGPDATYDSRFAGIDSAIIINKGYYWKFDYNKGTTTTHTHLSLNPKWKEFPAKDGIYPWTGGGPEATYHSRYKGGDYSIIMNQGYMWRYDYTSDARTFVGKVEEIWGSIPPAKLPPEPGDVKNVIILGWDAAQRDHFWEIYNRGELPNIKELSGNRIFHITVTDGATDTKAGWAQILTGYDAEVTGVYNVDVFGPIPRGYTVFEKLEDHFGRDNIVTLFLAGKTANVGGSCSPHGEMEAEPYCYTKEKLDKFQNAMGENEIVGYEALRVLEQHRNERFFAFIHFGEPDDTGHIYGENSAEYTQKIVDDDLWLGRIVAKLKELGIYGQTYIYVTVDHGFDEGRRNKSHRNAPFVFVATNDPKVMRHGDRKDIAPTILELYGLSLGRIGNAPAVDGYSLYSIPPISCVPEGEGSIDYQGAPKCCSGLQRIGLERAWSRGGQYYTADGGTGDNSGWCTKCGDGICKRPENLGNCEVDCR